MTQAPWSVAFDSDGVITATYDDVIWAGKLPAAVVPITEAQYQDWQANPDSIRIINGVATVYTPTQAEQTAALQSQLMSYAISAQTTKLTAGITVNVAASGSPVNVLCDGTSGTRADLAMLALFGQQSPTGAKTWLDNNGVATSLTGTECVALATLIGTWIDDCYAALATVMSAIAGGSITTTAAVDAAFAAVTA